MKTLLAWLLSPCLLLAQSVEKTKWSLEIEQDWTLDGIPPDAVWDSGVGTLKLLADPADWIYALPSTLSELVCRSADLGRLPIFKDPDCSIPTDWRSFLMPSDNHGFDPETGEETLPLAFCLDYDADAFKRWRLRQLLTYSPQKGRWSITALAIAPLVVEKNAAGDSVGTRPAFWFRPENGRQSVDAKNIVWAKKTVSGKQPGTALLPVSFLKNKADTPFSHVFQMLERRPKQAFYDMNFGKLLPMEQRKSILQKTPADTEATQTGKIHSSDITQIRLVQNWYWDARRSRLFICLDAVAPLVDVFDAEGNFRYHRVLFYQKG